MAGAAIWQVSDLRVMAAHRWDHVAIVHFERGQGEAVWHNGWQRLALATDDFPGAVIRVDRGRTLEGPLCRDQIMEHPAGIRTPSNHGAGRSMQVLLDPALVITSCLALSWGPAVVSDLALALHDPLCAKSLQALVREVQAGPGARLLVEGLTAGLAVQIARRIVADSPAAGSVQGLSHERLRVLDRVEAHLEEELTLGLLIEIACRCPWHFSRCLKQGRRPRAAPLCRSAADRADQGNAAQPCL